MYPVCLLLHILPLVLVEQRRVPGPSRAASILPLASRFARRTQRGTQSDARQQYESIPVPHDYELRTNLSQGVKSGKSDCRDKENYGILIMQFGNCICISVKVRASFIHCLFTPPSLFNTLLVYAMYCRALHVPSFLDVSCT